MKLTENHPVISSILNAPVDDEIKFQAIAELLFLEEIVDQDHSSHFAKKAKHNSGIIQWSGSELGFTFWSDLRRKIDIAERF